MLIPPTVCRGCGVASLVGTVTAVVTDWPAPSPLSVPPTTVSVAMPDGLIRCRHSEGDRDVSVVQRSHRLGSRLPLITGDILSIVDPANRCRDAAFASLSAQSPLLVRTGRRLRR